MSELAEFTYENQISNAVELASATDAYKAEWARKTRVKRVEHDRVGAEDEVEFSADRTFPESDTVAMLNMGGKGFTVRRTETGLVLEDELSQIDSERAFQLPLNPGESIVLGKNTTGQGYNDRYPFAIDPGNGYRDRNGGAHQDFGQEHAILAVSEDGKKLTVRGNTYTDGTFREIEGKVDVLRPISRRKLLARRIGATVAAVVVVGGGLFAADQVRDHFEEEKYVTITEQEMPDIHFSPEEEKAWDLVRETYANPEQRTFRGPAAEAIEAVSEAASTSEVDSVLEAYFSGSEVSVSRLEAGGSLADVGVESSREAEGFGDEKLEQYQITASAAIDAFDRLSDDIIADAGINKIVFVDNLSGEQPSDEDGLNGFAQSRSGNVVLDVQNAGYEAALFTAAHEIAHVWEDNAEGTTRLETLLQPLTHEAFGAPAYAEEDHGHYDIVNHEDPEDVWHGQRFFDRDYGNMNSEEDIADTLAGVMLGQFDLSEGGRNGVDEQKKRVAAVWVESQYPGSTPLMFQLSQS